MKYTLEKPVKLGDETITEVEFREPRMKDLHGLIYKDAALGNLKTEEYMSIAANLSGQLPALFDNISWSDGIEITGILIDFFERGQKTGQKS